MSLQQHQLTQMPGHVLKEKSLIWGLPVDGIEFAQRMDEEDPMASFRELFTFPKKRDLPYVDTERIQSEHEECLYLCGQSLGLKPKSVNNYCNDVLNSWGAKGVHAHFSGYLPSALADIPPKVMMSRMVGAKEWEVAVMNGVTVNLHILFASFYKPTTRRHKIIIEEHSFSSDMYVVKSQITLHGLDPKTSLITLKPRPGEYLIREEDALEVLAKEGDQVAVFLIPGIQYYSGQLFNIPKLTKAAHEKGITVGVDLAHAAGNVPLYMHDWNVDFAVWCTYKYMNSGAGCIGGIFVHERFTEKGSSSTFPMLKGWWGNTMESRFLMKDEFDGNFGADMMKLSNPPAVLCAMLMASLDIFSQTSMEEIFNKQFLLTGYLEYLITSNFNRSTQKSNGFTNGKVLATTEHTKNKSDMFTVDIITPSDPFQRGSQLSLSFSVPLLCVQEELQRRGIVCDVRMPNVMRVAPAPLYNSYTDVFNFVVALRDVCSELDGKFESEDVEDDLPAADTVVHTNGHNKSEDHDITLNQSGLDSPTPSSSSTSSNQGLSSSDSEPDSLVGTNTL